MDKLTIALWPVGMAAVPASVADAADRIEARLAEAAAAGAGLLMLPEYLGEQWLAWAPRDLPETEEVAWMGRHGAALLERLCSLPARHGVALLAGTWPARAGAGWVNRAHLLLPDGRIVVQDKLCLTPSEQNAAAWRLETGSAVRIVEWRGLRIAMLVCLDIEQPALAALLQAADLDLLLVPSMTRQASGHARVTGCAKARAVELMTTVAAVGCIGSIPVEPPRPNTGGAAVYLPCEAALGHHGIAVERLGIAACDGEGPLVIARDLPLGTVRELRRGGAEVWPGAWPASHVRLVEER
ncbi:MAG TPA: nitrilase-related carbon-nitrogen hydrolase [Geminicoccaceae bacterium]|nr:nitrilase-related carbon-nitrogen hydrolase [Geminicoccus sp.]HMU51962.1 nitrilase-related carbon-nitrogen hydrolase [Geminicoccaceae bacterium]